MARDLSLLEVRHLRLLVEQRERAASIGTVYDAWLEDFVLELREDGVSVRAVAGTISVGSSTVQKWTRKAQRRRDS